MVLVWELEVEPDGPTPCEVIIKLRPRSILNTIFSSVHPHNSQVMQPQLSVCGEPEHADEALGSCRS